MRTWWDLVLTNKEGLVENVRVGARLGCTDHEMIKFRILRVVPPNILLSKLGRYGLDGWTV